jgi:hypothetical protein
MVADPFVVARDEGHLDRDGDRHRAGHELRGQAHVQLVELVVELVEGVACRHVAVRERLGRPLPKLDPVAAHLVEQPADARGQLTRNTTCRACRDVLGEVVTPLELGHDPQDREQEPEVTRHRRLQRELALHQRFDLEVDLVDLRVARG